eukprot:gnl/Dysnectes_brevis/1568_a1778_726.p1 GENE.gnl/Dysnectes_brevis/1568_a1778_726~~gnl/Dysnectes_brevis/1568_a1778_726.p1  ORF type:complete len:895 (+),score=306.71 gnl/Dysnectes_brevis/1568_a1778_726:1690-4374(+)
MTSEGTTETPHDPSASPHSSRSSIRMLEAMIWKSFVWIKTQKCLLICNFILVLIFFLIFSLLLLLYKNIFSVEDGISTKTFYETTYSSYNYEIDQYAVLDPITYPPGAMELGWTSYKVGMEAGDEREGDGFFSYLPSSISSLYNYETWDYRQIWAPFVNETRLGDTVDELEVAIFHRMEEYGSKQTIAAAMAVPDGFMDFSEGTADLFQASGSSLSSTLRLGVGSESREWGMNAPERVVQAVVHLGQAFLNAIAGDADSSWNDFTLSTRQFPYRLEVEVEVDYLLLGFLLSLVCLPVISSRVKESEQGVKEILRLAGIHDWQYEVAWLAGSGSIALTIMGVIYALGLVLFRVPFFIANSFFAVLVLFLVWAFAASAWSGALYAIVRKGATTVGVLLMLAVPTVSLIISMVSGSSGSVFFTIIPNWALMTTLATMCGPTLPVNPRTSPRVTTSGIFHAGAFWASIARLLAVSVFWQLFTLYINHARGDEGKPGAGYCFFLRRGYKLPPQTTKRVIRAPDVTEAADRVESLFTSESPRFPVLVVRSLTKAFGANRAVDHVSLSIDTGAGRPAGEKRSRVCNIQFINHSLTHHRKTTLLSMVCGMLEPTEGAVYIRGRRTQGVREDWSSRRVGVCPQHDRVWGELSIYQHVRLFSWLRYRGPKVDKQDLDRRVKDILLRVGLRHVPNRPAGELSGGMLRRLSLAISMCGDPDLLLLDELSSGLDPSTKADILEVVRPLKESMAVILITHNLEDVEVVCDRIAIMHRGRLATISTYSSLLSRMAPSTVGRFQLVPGVPGARFAEQLRARLGDAVGKVEASSEGYCTVHFPQVSSPVSSVFEVLLRDKDDLSIVNFTLGSISLQDLFCMATNQLDEADKADMSGELVAASDIAVDTILI